MNESNSFDGSVPYFCQANADGTMSFFDSAGPQIPWPGFNTSQPPSQVRQSAPSTGEPHGNQEFMNPNHFNGMPIHIPSMLNAHNANPCGPGFLRPSQQRHHIFPPRTPHNIPDPPWNREASSSVSTSTSSASPRNSTPSDASPAGNHGANANANANPDTNTSANSSPTGLGGRTRFTCHLCSFSSKTQRDFDRHITTRAHLRKHGHHDTERTVRRFHCAVRDCRYASDKGFTRMDNLKRHERDKHKYRDTSDAVVRGGHGEGEVEEE